MIQPEQVYTNTVTNGLIFSILLQDYHYGIINAQFKDFDLINKSLNYTENISQKKIVDLGCGFGSAFILFLKKYFSYPQVIFHIDINPDVFLRENSSRGKELILFPKTTIVDLFYDWDQDVKMIANAEEIPLDDNAIDIVNISMLFADNYALKDKMVCYEVTRILKKDGLVFISDPDCSIGRSDDFQKITYHELPLINVYQKIR